MAKHQKRRLLFLHPKTLIDSWPMPVDTLGEIIKVPSIVYPLLAATLKELDLDIEIFDGYVTRETFRDYKARLQRADFIAITVTTPMKALDTELNLQLARRLNPNVRVILGGNQATAFPEEWLTRGADYVVMAEGEQSFPALMRRLCDGIDQPSDVPGIAFRGVDGAPVRTLGKNKELVMDDAPIPDWGLMDLSPYQLGMAPKGATATLEVSRGCPHRCDFCNINRFWGYRQRYKTLPRVLDEMGRLHRIGVRQFFFADDNFGHDHEYTCELFEEMIRRNWDFRFGAFVRGDTIQRHPEFAKLASRAGLRMALMGIETLDERWLKDHRKGVPKGSPEIMYRGVYQTLRSNDIFLVGLFINSIAEGATARPTGRSLDGNVCDFHYTADLMPQKGSALFSTLQLDKKTRLKPMFYHDWNLPCTQSDGSFQRNHKTLRELLRNFDGYVFRALFSSRPVLRRFWWRHLAIATERLLCTTRGDFQRYLWAKAARLPLDERQRRIVDSVLNSRFVDGLVAAKAWKSPLTLRNGFWSAGVRQKKRVAEQAAHS
jgi:anaerobic magnesium-protoporphyrin IX monomethyl ester cyclase